MADNRQQTDPYRTEGTDTEKAITGVASEDTQPTRGRNDGTGLYPGEEDLASGGLRSGVLAQSRDEDDDEDLDEDDEDEMDDEDDFDDEDEDEEEYED